MEVAQNLGYCFQKSGSQPINLLQYTLNFNKISVGSAAHALVFNKAAPFFFLLAYRTNKLFGLKVFETPVLGLCTWKNK